MLGDADRLLRHAYGSNNRDVLMNGQNRANLYDAEGDTRKAADLLRDTSAGTPNEPSARRTRTSAGA